MKKNTTVLVVVILLIAGMLVASRYLNLYPSGSALNASINKKCDNAEKNCYKEFGSWTTDWTNARLWGCLDVAKALCKN